MMFSIREQELSLLGVERPRVEIADETSESDIAVSCRQFEKTIDETCGYDIDYGKRITALCDDFSADELERFQALGNEEVFAVKHDLLRVDDDSHAGGDPQAKTARREECTERLSDLLIQKVLIGKALERKRQTAVREGVGM